MTHDNTLRNVNIYRIIKWSKGISCPKCHSLDNLKKVEDIFPDRFYTHKCEKCDLVFYIDEDMCKKCNFKDDGGYTEEEAMDFFRQIRWDNGVFCPWCHSPDFQSRGNVKINYKETKRKRYTCKSCGKTFDDFTDTFFSGKRGKPFKKTLKTLYKIFSDDTVEKIAGETELKVNYVQEIEEEFKHCFDNEKEQKEMLHDAHEFFLCYFLQEKSNDEENFP